MWVITNRRVTTIKRRMVVDKEKFQEMVLQQLQILTEGQQKLTDGQSQLADGQQQLSNRLDLVEEGQVRIENRLGLVERGQVRLEKRIESVENGQVKLEMRLEHEVIDKIRALFDARQSQEEKLECIMEKLNNISTNVSYLVARIVKLEELVK